MNMSKDRPQDGFHRRIRLFPRPGHIVAGLEDNLHHFTLALSHQDGIVTGVGVETGRYPWTTCAAAPNLLREQLIGINLGEVAELNIFAHCTHLFELVVLCAAHAHDTAPSQFDLHVAEWAGEQTRVRLWADGLPILNLEVDGRLVRTPGEWFGHDLLQPAQWRAALEPAQAEAAMLVSRAIYVSLGRISKVVERASERGPAVVGVCYSYQPERVGDALRMPDSRKEFAQGAERLLDDFDPLAQVGE